MLDKSDQHLIVPDFVSNLHPARLGIFSSLALDFRGVISPEKQTAFLLKRAMLLEQSAGKVGLDKTCVSSFK